MNQGMEDENIIGDDDSFDVAPYISSIFVITGMELRPNECTTALNLIPTDFCAEAKLTGLMMPSGEPFRRKPFWSIDFVKQRSYSVDDELNRLIDVLWPRRREIVRFLKTTSNEAAFVTNVTIYHDRPRYELSPRTLQRLAYFGCEWGLDIFDFREGEARSELEWWS